MPSNIFSISVTKSGNQFLLPSTRDTHIADSMKFPRATKKSRIVNAAKRARLLLLAIIVSATISSARGGFLQDSQSEYLANFDSIVSASYAVIDDPSVAPAEILSVCQGSQGPAPTEEVVVHPNNGGSVIGAAFAQTKCGSNSVCVVPSGVKLLMDNDLNVGALVVKGAVEWTDVTQGGTPHRYLCAGYVAVEENGSFSMSLQEDGMGWVYIKDNGAEHPMLRTRAFGTAGSGSDNPTVDIDGREMKRTWTLLSQPLNVGDMTMKVMHDPARMGWRVGDRIGIATTKSGSGVKGQTFRVIGLTENGLQLDQASIDDHGADFLPGNDFPILQSAEVVNLSRNIIITGDDFSQVQCSSSLPESVTGEQTSVEGYVYVQPHYHLVLIFSFIAQHKMLEQKNSMCYCYF
jgi:hypothetical protein